RLQVPCRAQGLGQVRVVLAGRRAARLVAAPVGRLDHADLACPKLLVVRPGQCACDRRVARVAAEEVLPEHVLPDRLRRSGLRSEPSPAGRLDGYQTRQWIVRIEWQEVL